ncbi:MAG: acetyl-CoA carboxylase biotin carboxylase subunit [Bacillaceae bacterium]|nr:acetyl-CoA carboxylase biotin carboxylase subunit [Bacillaceae bacterium]
MFQKILIANRGEIALRVINTCKKLNIPTVAVYSEADRDAPHVRAADETYLLGAAPVNQSYLNIDRILEIVDESGADAVHPGYGLLSENPLFARKLKEKGITFIGPEPEMMEAMGDKLVARRIMKQAGVPVIPGTMKAIDSVDEACSHAEEIGYPVMLKAAAGGGGIGMQIVGNESELRKAFAANQKRVQTYFGNGAMYIEKYVANPRHIEVQILADRHSNRIHLGERECSIQRRHQKVIEEAPSPFVDDNTRQRIGEAALAAAESIKYVNAGTVEFLMDENKNFYFIEMNTRIQVEHPVTEEVYGIDLIAEQIAIAAGKPLSMRQEEIKPTGHAIECRIYAEDPDTFYPAPGLIKDYQPPAGEGIRLDDGVTSGYNVTPFYDPMIAKLIVSAENRESAINRMKKALDQYKIEGIKHNIPMLIKVLEHPHFIAGNTTTDFLQKQLASSEGRE